MKYSALLLVFGGLLSAETFPVNLVKPLWRDGKGTLEITDQGVSYRANEKKRGRDWIGARRVGRALDGLTNRPPSLSWTWLDIQYLDRVNREELVVLTYKDDWRYLGRDREYRFRVDKGEIGDALFARMSAHLKRPVTDRVPPAKTAALYSIPVKREGAFRGSDGVLEFSGDAIYYLTAREGGGRTWLMDRDIVSVWSDDPYRLEIRAYDNNRREFSRTATYKFDLKEKLDPEFYRSLKLKLYNLESAGDGSR